MRYIDLTKRKILFEMLRFAKELSETKIPQLYELGHYLTDNLISKVSMLIGQENGIKFEYIIKSGEKRTRDFKWLYENILLKVYPSAPDFSDLERLHNQRNIYQHDSFAIDHHFNQQYALDYIEITRRILLIIGIIDNQAKVKATNFIRKESIDVQEIKKSENHEKENLIRFYHMISHNIKFTKGKLISLVRHLGKHNINKYLDLEFFDESDYIQLSNSLWIIIIWGPGIPHRENFEIHKLKEPKGIYRDDPENLGDKKVYSEFINYLSIKIGITNKKVELTEKVQDPTIIERDRRVQAIFDIIKDILKRASSQSCVGKGAGVTWQINWNIPKINYITEIREMLKNFEDDLRYLFLDKSDPLTILAGRYKITEKEIITESSLKASQTFEDHRQIILDDIKNNSKKFFNIDLN